MSRIPRLLPLIAIAAGGVLAVRAVSTLEGAPDFLQGAVAWAEEAPAKEAAKAAPAKGAPAAAAAATPAAAVVAARPSAPVCAPSAAELAREAGLSPAELRVLQSLGERRGQLDARERAFETQVQLLNAAETKVEARIKALNALKAELTGLLGQTDQRREAEVARLVKVYESMKPKDAAAVMATLDDSVRLPVAAKMKERSLAAVLAQMPPAQAKILTEKLAQRFQSEAIGQRVAAASAGGPTAPAAAAPPPAATAAAGSAESPPAKAAPRPRRPRPAPARAAPRPPAAAMPSQAAASAPQVPPPPPTPSAPPSPARAQPRGDGPV